MKKRTTPFLQFVICLVAMVALTWLIVFPKLDPFIIYTYIGSVPFFMALYQAWKLFGYIAGNQVFSQLSVNTVKNIKYDVIAFSGFIMLGILYIRLFVKGDDPAGVTGLAMVTILACIVIATVAAVFQRLLQNAIVKSIE